MWPTPRLSISLTGIVLMCISKSVRRQKSHDDFPAEEIPACIARIKLEAAHLFNIRRPNIKVGQGRAYYRHQRPGDCAVSAAGCSDARLITTCPTRFCERD